MSDNPETPPDAGDIAPVQTVVEAADPQAGKRRHHLRRELFWTLVILAAFTGLELWLEHTHFGHHLEVEAHRWFHSLVDRRSARENSPVVIVDIGKLKQRNYEVWSTNTSGEPVRQELEFTPREQLQELLETIARARPAAIGFDLDLSPERELKPGPALEQATSNLLQSALTITTNGVPVVFGVARAISLGPSAWLSDGRYSRMAGAIPRRRGEARQLPAGILLEGHLLPSLSKAVADAGRDQTGGQHRPWRGLGWAVELVSVEIPEPKVPGFEWRQFYVNYSPLNFFRTNLVAHSTVLGTSPEKLAGLFQGKLVITGDASSHQLGDTVMIPGQDEPMAGVFAHACGTHTLVEAPLWRLNHWVGTVLAFALSLLVAWVIFEICWAIAAHHSISTIPLTVLLTVAACIITVAVAWTMMLARVMWLEVFLTVFVLVTHCIFEVFVFSANWPKLKGGPAKLGEALVVPPHSGEIPPTKTHP